jgi:hypothetical protein
MKYLLYTIFTIVLLTSCSDDEATSETLLINYDNLVVTTSVKNIGLDAATLVLSTSETTPTATSKRFLYRVSGAENFTESNNAILTNLVQGKRYEAKTRVTIDGVDYDSEIISFVTIGFIADSQTLGEVRTLNKKFTLTFIEGVQSTFAEPLTAYIKIGQDSIQVSAISYADNIMTFDIDKETQGFFENDTAYIPHKAFTLGLFSGDYYQNITPSFSAVKYDGKTRSQWSIFNKNPYLESYADFKNEDCLNSESRKVIIDITGKFWGDQFGDTESQPNSPDTITIQLTRLDNSGEEQVYSIEDTASISNINNSCDTSAFARIHNPTTTSEGGNPGFHESNFVRLGVNTKVIMPGNYKLTFAVEKNNVIFTSNELNVSID